MRAVFHSCGQGACLQLQSRVSIRKTQCKFPIRKSDVTQACSDTRLPLQVSGTVACSRAGGKISRQVQRAIIRKGVGYGWSNFFGCTQPVQRVADIQRFVVSGNLMLQVGWLG